MPPVVQVAGPARREHWSSSFGFLLAALGAAVGLGNVWRFSYLVGANGGGAFLLLYCATLLIIGVPLLIAELAIGQRAQSAPQHAFAVLTREHPDSPALIHRLRGIGWLQVIAPAFALSYYSVLTGWVLRYAFVFGARLIGIDSIAVDAAAFRGFIAAPLAPLLWHGLAMGLCALIVMRGVRRGIEATSRVLMPLLALLLVVLAIDAQTLSGAPAARAFLFVPHWPQLLEPRVMIAAMGQAFFSIGLASGVLLTYGAYLRPDIRLPGLAVRIVIGDTLFAIIAGLIVFPAVFTLGVAPNEGPALSFVTLPTLFARMRWGDLFGLAFFVLLGLAALTSAVSLLEVPVAALLSAHRRRRAPTVLWVALACYIVGVPAALGYGPLAAIRVPGGAGLALLDAFDRVLSNGLLPANGIVIALVTGWAWRRGDALRACGLPGRLARLWLFWLRWVMPVLIALVLLGGFWFERAHPA